MPPSCCFLSRHRPTPAPGQPHQPIAHCTASRHPALSGRGRNGHAPPKQTESWRDCKAAYRLIDNDDVSFAAITATHHAATRARTDGTWLVISDTTETHFPGVQVRGLGPTGDGGGRGFLLHSALMVRADGREIAGLAAQVIHYRRKVKKETNGAERLRRKDRESVIWGQVIDQIGSAPEGVRFIHVFDRGGDQFELYCRILRTKAGWVGRAAQLKRKIRTPQGAEMALSAYLEQLPVAGTYSLQLRANTGQPARQATMEVRFGQLIVPRPKHCSRWRASTQPGRFWNTTRSDGWWKNTTRH